jgi:hypothetical protein
VPDILNDIEIVIRRCSMCLVLFEGCLIFDVVICKEDGG